MKFFLAIGLLLGTSLAPVFSQSAVTQEEKGEALILKVAKGGFWNYQVQVSTPITLGEALKAQPLKKDGLFHYFYDEKRVYQGEGLVAGLTEAVGSLEVFLEGNTEPREVQYVGIKPDGYWSFGALVKNSAGQTSRVLLKNPMPLLLKKGKPGMEWTWKAGELVYEFRVIGLEEVIVPAGQYQALKIQVNQSNKGLPQKLRYYWFADGVGIVKELEEHYLPKSLVVKKSWELKEVNLQGSGS